MEKILQHLVKIIIIGSLCEKTSVLCNRQFLPPPPLPYYHNDDYYNRGFVPSYQESYPVYYQDQNGPPPISYQNINYFSPPQPQLFHQNENYHPPPYSPRESYPIPEIHPHKGSYYQSLYGPYRGVKRPQMNNYMSPPQPPKYQPAGPSHKNAQNPPQPAGEPSKYQQPQISYANPSESTQEEPKTQPPKESPQKIKVHATNVVQKEDSYQPYYPDSYNDEEYSDNYSDDSSYSDPCVPDTPYRLFQSNPNLRPDAGAPAEGKFTLCSPYFQPNFGHGFHSLKTPITLLPSRFPPRVEQIIERIQNYFSTYNQQGMQKPHNQTTTASPSTAAPGESEAPSLSSMAEDSDKKNTTGENLQETHSGSAVVAHLEPVTERTEVTPQNAEIERQETSSTTEADVKDEKQSETETQTTPTSVEATDGTPHVVTEIIVQVPQKVEEDLHHPKAEEIVSTEGMPPIEISTEKQTSHEPEESTTAPEEMTTTREPEAEGPDTKGSSNSTESADIVSKTEEHNDIPTASERHHLLTDNNG